MTVFHSPYNMLKTKRLVIFYANYGYEQCMVKSLLNEGFLPEAPMCVCVKTFPQNQYHTMIPPCTQETLVLYLL